MDFGGFQNAHKIIHGYGLDQGAAIDRWNVIRT
jgi:hypothetical protein